VRAVPLATIVIAAGTGVGAVAALIGAVVALLAQRHTQRRRPASAEAIKVVRLKKAKRQQTIAATATSSKEELVQQKLNEAQTLINNDYYHAAIIMLGVVLGHTLREAVRRSNVTLTHSLNSKTRMVRILVTEGAINKSDVAATRLLTEICDRATHDFTEPSAEEARLAVELLRRILPSLSG
jgi:hypothetical protein